MKKFRIAVIVLSTLFVLLLGFSLLWYLPYHIDPPNPPTLFAHYESEEGPQTRYGFLSGRNFGNWLGKLCMSGFEMAPDGVDDPQYAEHTITVPAGTMLRFTNQAENGRKRYRMAGARIDIRALENYDDSLVDIRECEVLNKHEFQYAAPDTPGRYRVWLYVDFRSNGSASYRYFLDVT